MATKPGILAGLTRRFADLGKELGFFEPFVRAVPASPLLRPGYPGL